MPIGESTFNVGNRYATIDEFSLKSNDIRPGIATLSFSGKHSKWPDEHWIDLSRKDARGLGLAVLAHGLNLDVFEIRSIFESANFALRYMPDVLNGELGITRKDGSRLYRGISEINKK